VRNIGNKLLCRQRNNARSDGEPQRKGSVSGRRREARTH
jgi:hypothetical protein